MIARKGKFKVAIEYDHHEVIKWKSFQKIVQIKPDVAIGITGNGDLEPNVERASKYKDRCDAIFYVVSLKPKQYQKIEK